MAREWVFLECPECGTRYYRTTKDKKVQAKLQLTKFCRMCRRRTSHREKKR